MKSLVAVLTDHVVAIHLQLFNLSFVVLFKLICAIVFTKLKETRENNASINYWHRDVVIMV